MTSSSTWPFPPAPRPGAWTPIRILRGQRSDGSRTFYYRGLTTDLDPGDFRQATETDVDMTPADANYAVFEGLTGAQAWPGPRCPPRADRRAGLPLCRSPGG